MKKKKRSDTCSAVTVSIFGYAVRFGTTTNRPTAQRTRPLVVGGWVGWRSGLEDIAGEGRFNEFHKQWLTH